MNPPNPKPLCDLFLNAGTVILLIFTPLAFGAVHVWAFSLMEMGTFFLIIVWMGKLLLQGVSPDFIRTTIALASSGALPFLLFVGLVLFQLVPLPPGLLRVLSPATYQLYETALPGWPHQEPFTDLPEIINPTNSTNPSPWLSLSVYREVSQVELLKLVSYCAFFALVALRGFPLLILRSLIALGTGLGLLAFLQQATWNGKLLWFFVPYHWGSPQPGSEGRLHGPFVNPDHFAGYLAMIVPLAVAAVLICGRRVRVMEKNHSDSLPIGSGAPAWITRIVSTLSSLQALSCGLSLLAAAMILSALVFTLSRGAFSAAFAALFFMAWLLWPHSRGKEQKRGYRNPINSILTKLGRAACLLGFLSVPVMYLEYPQVFGRFLQIPQEVDGGRPVIYAATLALWRDFPLFGVGLGNFQEVFPRYQPPAVGQAFTDYTHNDYLQLLAETGLIGFLLLVGCIADVLRRAAHSWSEVTGEQRLWLAGILTGIVAVLLHSLVDFNLYISANALLFATLLALSVRIGKSSWSL